MACIIKPLVTEKQTKLTEKQNKFGFIVRPDVNKIEIKKEGWMRGEEAEEKKKGKKERRGGGISQTLTPLLFNFLFIMKKKILVGLRILA